MVKTHRVPSLPVAHAVSDAFPAFASKELANVDVEALMLELEEVAQDALLAQSEGLTLPQAVQDPRFPTLGQFHQNLRDSMFVELPGEIRGWVDRVASHQGPAHDLGSRLTEFARPGPSTSSSAELQAALSQVLLFEAVRLRLLATIWGNSDFERLGGEESEVDEIAFNEVIAMLGHPGVDHPDVRPLRLMYAAASVSLAAHANGRAEDLHRSSAELRETLDMRAKLKAALRELRLTESVLLENALASLLGEERVELPDLQQNRPMALEGLSRQAMDQRVSRGRRALTQSPQSWPKRRQPALVDLITTAPKPSDPS